MFRKTSMALAAGLLLGVSGCQDGPTDPLAELVAAESNGALALGLSLPDPADWQVSVAPDGSPAAWVLAWRASWDLPEEEGRRVRQEGYDGLQEDSATVAPARLEGQIASLGEAVAAALALPAGELPPKVLLGIEAAATLHADAQAAMERGDHRAAAVDLLRGADALREVGPEAMARALLASAELGLGRIQPPSSYAPADLERVRRLIAGAREALEDGEWLLALRRGWYATGLLAGGG